jgi:hypothetical protein
MRKRVSAGTQWYDRLTPYAVVRLPSGLGGKQSMFSWVLFCLTRGDCHAARMDTVMFNEAWARMVALVKQYAGTRLHMTAWTCVVGSIDSQHVPQYIDGGEIVRLVQHRKGPELPAPHR